MNNKGKHLGELIRKRREELGLTQDQLASLTLKYGRTAYQYISNCERGKAGISPKYFPLFANALKISKRRILDAYLLDCEEMAESVFVGHSFETID